MVARQKADNIVLLDTLVNYRLYDTMLLVSFLYKTIFQCDI